MTVTATTMMSKQERKKLKGAFTQVSPQQKTFNGRLALSFKDVLKNLIIQEIKGTEAFDVAGFNEKIRTSSMNSNKNKHGLSAKHRKRLLRQAKRLNG